MHFPHPLRKLHNSGLPETPTNTANLTPESVSTTSPKRATPRPIRDLHLNNLSGKDGPWKRRTNIYR